jgi:sensor domain CHASE-containing protein
MIPIFAASARPLEVTTDQGPAAGLKIVAKNGDQFVIVLSGEGMRALIEDMQSFLESSPQIAKIQSQARQ